VRAGPARTSARNGGSQAGQIPPRFRLLEYLAQQGRLLREEPERRLDLGHLSPG
jgi:hypothetical protein